MKSNVDFHTEKHFIHPDYPEKAIRIGARLSKEAKLRLVTLLKQYSKVFVWKPTDMKGSTARSVSTT